MNIIRLQIRLSDDEVLEGTQLDAPLRAEQRAALLAMPYLAGTLWIEHAGQPAIEILDDLAELVPRLCLLPLRRLEAGETVAVDMFASDERVTLAPQAAQVAVTTSWGEAALVPAAALAAGLRRCGLQFFGFVERNLGEDAGWRERADDLRDLLRGLGELPTEPAAEPEVDPEPEPPAVSDQVMREILAEQEAGRP